MNMLLYSTQSHPVYIVLTYRGFFTLQSTSIPKYTCKTSLTIEFFISIILFYRDMLLNNRILDLQKTCSANLSVKFWNWNSQGSGQTKLWCIMSTWKNTHLKLKILSLLLVWWVAFCLGSLYNKLFSQSRWGKTNNTKFNHQTEITHMHIHTSTSQH